MRLILLSFILLMTAVSFSNADECKDILIEGAFSKINISYERENINKLHDYLCMSDAGSNSKYEKFKTDAMYDGMRGALGYRSDRHEEWYRAHCEEHSRYSYNYDNTNIWMEMGDSKIVNAWSKCMERQNNGLLCKIERNEEEGLFKLIVNWKNHDRLSLEDVRITEQSNVHPFEFESFFHSNDTLNLTIEVKDSRQASHINIRGKSTAGTMHSCTVTVPPLKAFNRPRVKKQMHAYLMEIRDKYSNSSNLQERIVGRSAGLQLAIQGNEDANNKNRAGFSWHENEHRPRGCNKFYLAPYGSAMDAGGYFEFDKSYLCSLFTKMGLICVTNSGPDIGPGDKCLNFKAP